MSSEILPKDFGKPARNESIDLAARSTWNRQDNIMPGPGPENINSTERNLQADKTHSNQNSDLTF